MLGIIGAMDVEVDAIKKKISNPVTTNLAGCDFVCGFIESVMVCVAQCNPGKVNAALCTQAMIDKFHLLLQHSSPNELLQKMSASMILI